MTQAASPQPQVRVRTRQRQLDVGVTHLEGSIHVTRKRYGSEPEEIIAQKIHVPAFEVAPAYVGIKAKETRNTGDYNSVSVEVSLSLPCYPEESELRRVYMMGSDVVESWLGREIARATDPNWQG